jgi:hypothetical protein
MTEPLNIWVVGVISADAKDEKVASAGTLAHPLEGSIEIFSSTQQSEAALALRLYVRGAPGAKIFIVRAGCK